VLATFCSIVLMPIFSILSLPLQLLTPPPVHRHDFPSLFFVVVFYGYFTWRWFDAFFLTFLQLVKRFQLKNWFVLAIGLTESLTQVVFRQPFVIQHVRTRSLNCETWNFWYFYILINMKWICDLWCYCFSLAAFVLFRDLSHKHAWINHTIPHAVNTEEQILKQRTSNFCIRASS